VSGRKTPPLGTLRERVDMAAKTTTIGTGGGQIITYAPLGRAWARVTAKSARTTDFGDAAATLATHTVVLRFRTDIGPGDRITWRGQAFEIVDAADLNGRRAYLSCQCRQIKVMG
jgi:SPP1 family predicted phage head-tail adaptor